MTLEAFVAPRRDRWAALEALLGRSHRGRLRDIPAAELERFGTLYREAASDLAIARRDFPDDDITVFLNNLCARAHPVLFRSSPVRARELLRRFAVGVPRSFRERRAYILLSLGLLLAGVVAGWLAVELRPDLRASLIPPSGFDQLARGQVSSLPSAPTLGTVIITNNIKVAAICFLGGALAGVPTALILAANGWMLGTIAAAVHQGGYDLAFWSLILPHGVLELSIIVIAGATGLYVGDAILRPGLLRRSEAFSRAALTSLALAAGATSLLIVAGLLEAYVSPSGLPAAAKLLVGAVVGVALYSWLLLTGRSRRRPAPVRLDSVATGPSRQPG
ncbi:MAG: stage II sporulation protein M [Candidatus Dormibacteraeota bacterium]|uniref:Stage II sporulation protein M n=1 Tax=Candidatus Amunia macphersoniae TaxID=3127014 RepID=A0A934KQP2_9BACT|nr:stage II sporulation protein M [Candidatus Dormibacteraeota bacterium]